MAFRPYGDFEQVYPGIEYKAL